MADLTTKYMGLSLNSPIIVGSCGLTSSLNKIKQIEKNGAGAVVLKSIFEEEILLDINKSMDEASKDSMLYYEYSESYDYLDLHIKKEKLSNYLQLIKDVKKEVLIPVIASINCVTDMEWTSFAKEIENAGADALELNLFFNPTGSQKKDNEQITLSIIEKIKKIVTIPVSVKLSSYYSSLGYTIQKIAESGIDGIVLFNRFYSVDFDIEKFNVINSNIFSSENEYVKPLRWIALLSDRVKCGLGASSGIHTSDAVVKQILAGANVVQIVSALYKKGIDYISTLNNELEKWMDIKGYQSVNQFRGKMSYKNVKNHEVFERMQFIKYYSGIE